MALPGEIHPDETVIECPDCGTIMYLTPLHTCAWYAGFSCPKCGPYSRETDYMKTREEVENYIECSKSGISDPLAVHGVRV